MKVWLTHGYFIGNDPLEQKIMKPYPPLGILYISAYLHQQKIDNKLFDSTFSDRESWWADWTAYQPDVMAIYTNLMTKVQVLALVQEIKKLPEGKRPKIVLGGPDITYNVDNYLAAGADFLVIGEGEQSVTELVQGLESGADLSTIPGLAFKQNGETVQTPARVKIKNLNELPMPNREGIDLDRYLKAWKGRHGYSAINVSTQRGCPYTCKWCSTAVYGQSYRRRDPVQVADEIEFLLERYQPDSIWFVDDVFTVSHKWLEAFYQEVKKRKLVFQYECITRAERMSEDVLHWLKESGCFRVWIGAESGSQKVIDAMDRRVNVSTVQDMLVKTRQKGMETGTFIMLGYPGEEEEDIVQTVKYLKAANPSQFTITKSYPIKGTALYNEIESKLTKVPEWTTSTDRELDFERPYSDKYYHFAVRWVVNEVSSHQEWVKNGPSVAFWKLKGKSLFARTGMRLHKKGDRP
ncbi:B12-binding domain-containing radical SAM protein [bacterium SCSIO 12741]|nr:B12-binding domain-containing radical SAM protein [bacterium SCSIO 12741]